jgi:hypothetical protein
MFGTKIKFHVQIMVNVCMADQWNREGQKNISPKNKLRPFAFCSNLLLVAGADLC